MTKSIIGLFCFAVSILGFSAHADVDAYTFETFEFNANFAVSQCKPYPTDPNSRPCDSIILTQNLQISLNQCHNEGTLQVCTGNQDIKIEKGGIVFLASFLVSKAIRDSKTAYFFVMSLNSDRDNVENFNPVELILPSNTSLNHQVFLQKRLTLGTSEEDAMVFFAELTVGPRVEPQSAK